VSWSDRLFDPLRISNNLLQTIKFLLLCGLVSKQRSELRPHVFLTSALCSNWEIGISGLSDHLATHLERLLSAKTRLEALSTLRTSRLTPMLRMKASKWLNTMSTPSASRRRSARHTLFTGSGLWNGNSRCGKGREMCGSRAKLHWQGHLFSFTRYL
jgi:hypothetical protein